MIASPQQRFGHLVNAERFASMQPSIGPVVDGCYFPPEFYTSEEWFGFEKEAIFYRSWLCVGRADLLKVPGDYFTITINDDPLLVLMDDQETKRSQ